MPTEPHRSACPVAAALDLVGDRWTLLVIRDLLILGKRTYSEFRASPEAIPTNILADRLRRLEAAGLLRRRPYSARPPRHAYEPTEAAEALRPVLASLADWGRARQRAARAARNAAEGGGEGGDAPPYSGSPS